MTNALGIAGRYPPTIQQRGIIAMLTNDPDINFSFMMKLAFLVTPRIDLRRLERTFAKLAARHDALRQSFERRGDAWFVNVWKGHRTGLIVEDHGDISDAEFHALLEDHSSVQIDVLDEVLFQAIVLRCGGRGDVLFVRCHHAVVDAHSLIVLIEDWLNLLIGIPLFGRGITHEEYLSEHSNPSPQQRIDNQKYWNQLLLPALPNPGMGKFGISGERPRIVYRTDTARSLRCSLTSDEFNEIPNFTNARSETPFSLVLAAYADTIVELGELPGIYVSTIVDRTSKKLRNYVGCAIRWPPIRCDAPDGKSLAEYSSSLASQWKQSLDHLPSEAAAFDLDFDLAVHKDGGTVRHFNCSTALADARMKISPFSSGFMAVPDTPQKIGPLIMTRLAIDPSNHNFSGIALRIMPFADQVAFEFKYHIHFYTEMDMKALLSGMQERLQTRFS